MVLVAVCFAGGRECCVYAHIVMVLRSTHILNKAEHFALQIHIDVESLLRRFCLRSAAWLV